MCIRDSAFGYVPTPAIVAPLEFTLTKENYQNLGGHVDDIRTIKDIFLNGGEYGKDMKVLEDD